MTTFLVRLDWERHCFHVETVPWPDGQPGWVALAPEMTVVAWNGQDGIEQVVPIVGRDDLRLFQLAEPLAVAEETLEAWWVEDGQNEWMRYLVFGLVHALQERAPAAWAGEIPVLIGAPPLPVRQVGRD